MSATFTDRELELLSDKLKAAGMRNESTVRTFSEQVSAAVANKDASLMAALNFVRAMASRIGVKFNENERFSQYELNRQLAGHSLDERMAAKSAFYRAGLIEP